MGCCTWDDPIEVAIFHLLIVFILFHIEVGEVKEAKLKCLVEDVT